MSYPTPFFPYIGIPNQDMVAAEDEMGACQECFCASLEDFCWYCQKVTVRKRVITTGNGHRHDPSTKAVSLGGRVVPVENGLHYLREEVECTPSSDGAS